MLNHENNKDIKILIVDDDTVNLKLLSFYFNREGYQVFLAEHGRKAIEIALDEEPNIILMDIMMPGIDGIEACKRLKDIDITKNIPVLFLSALNETVDKIKGFEVGGVDFITKPCQSEEVLARVTSHLKIRKLTENLEEKCALLNQEISERKIVEKKLQNSLKEKEILIYEIYHRVKNNMQVISDLLDFQSQKHNDLTIRKILKESQERIKSMALVHQKLYQSKNLSNINFAEYIIDLTDILFRSYDIEENKVSLSTEIGDINLDINYAVPLALVLNELVSNALKHAFPENKQGKINIKFHKNSNDEIDFFVKDNGVGLTRGFNFDELDSLGFEIVEGLVKHQLGGNLELINEGGLEVKVSGIKLEDRKDCDLNKVSPVANL